MRENLAIQSAAASEKAGGKAGIGFIVRLCLAVFVFWFLLHPNTVFFVPAGTGMKAGLPSNFMVSAELIYCQFAGSTTWLTLT